MFRSARFLLIVNSSVSPESLDSNDKGKEKATKAKVEEKKQPEKGKKTSDKQSGAKTTSKATPKAVSKTSPKLQKSGKYVQLIGEECSERLKV